MTDAYLVLHGLAIKKHADAAAIAEAVGLDVAEVQAALDRRWRKAAQRAPARLFPTSRSRECAERCLFKALSRASGTMRPSSPPTSASRRSIETSRR